MQALIEKIGRSVGGVVGTLFQAGRDAVDLCLKTIIPFMAFVTFVIGLILETGVGDAIANGIKGFASSLGGLMIVCIICAIPVLSPLLGPGAVIAQIVGVLIGTEIGRGNIDVSMALPALFAINKFSPRSVKNHLIKRFGCHRPTPDNSLARFCKKSY